jgi:hypothetical protein
MYWFLYITHRIKKFTKIIVFKSQTIFDLAAVELKMIKYILLTLMSKYIIIVLINNVLFAILMSIGQSA